MITRIFNLNQFISKKKVLIIYGPRRVGKTTLLQDFLSQSTLKIKSDSGDNIRTQAVLNSRDFKRISDYVSGYELLAIDEAQQIEDIGMGLKIIVDNHPDLIVIATGSSSFDLAQKTGEPLTGRKRTLMLYPFSQQELLSLYNIHELKEKLDELLIFGSYPEVILASNRNEKTEILTELVNSYLLKDVLALENIKGTQQIFDLLRLLAFQVGSEVSFNELATKIKMDVKTVIKYIDLLEKGFVIRRLGAFSGNLRREISKKSKYYFLDNGIRNGIILQFNDLEHRDDIGKLFENFIISERIKFLSNNQIYKNLYFWRTYDGWEIDLIEEGDGHLNCFEIKWNPEAKITAPREFLKSYQNSDFKVIHAQNYPDFLL
jgi:uncharacterized protein